MTSADQEHQAYRPGPAERLEADPALERMRRSGTLGRVTMPYGGDAWLATRHEHVRAVLVDPRFSREATIGQDVPRPIPIIPSDPSILFMDPPRHTRLRNVVSRAFAARRIEALRPSIEQVVNDLLDRMVEQGPPADLIAGLAAPLPTAVICQLLGVPFEDRQQFLAWSEATLSVTGYEPQERMAAAMALKDYLAGMIRQRRHTPTDDLLGVVAAAQDDAGGLTEEELIVLGITLLVAGDETVMNQVGNFVYILLTNPHHLALLRDRPELLPTAIEELLRIVPLGAVPQSPSVATEDVEIGAVTVRAGETVVVDLGAADRDEAVFADPACVDLTRNPNPHVAFGHGTHHCIGAQLARIELQVAIGSLLDRLPGLRLAVPAAEVTFVTGRLARGLESLPVTWSGVAGGTP